MTESALQTVTNSSQCPLDSSSLAEDLRWAISEVPSYAGFARNRQSRAGDLKLSVPIHHDMYTEPWDEKYGYHIPVDNIIFGPGGCGLQVTFGAESLTKARILHDQLVPIGPIIAALTAASPIQRGVLLATDLRWNQIAGGLDARTAEEKQHLPMAYGTSPAYLAPDCTEVLPHAFHTPRIPYELNIATRLQQEVGMDPVMARYLAHIHMWDPIRLTTPDLETENSTAIFEKVYGTQWPHVRLKIPFQRKTGWLVEFRPMEIQPSDHENAAFAVFMCLVRQMVSHFNLNLYMPISLVAENMERAHVQDAVLTQKFWVCLLYTSDAAEKRIV